MIKLKDLIKEENDGGEFDPFLDFAGNRWEGATKITNDAKQKGGDAILTYHHFKVKLPYYEKAKNGEFNIDSAKKELRGYMEELCGGKVKMNQIGFQELMGLIEVLGELIIKHNELK
jgi:hypothetical protein